MSDSAAALVVRDATSRARRRQSRPSRYRSIPTTSRRSCTRRARRGAPREPSSRTGRSSDGRRTRRCYPSGCAATRWSRACRWRTSPGSRCSSRLAALGIPVYLLRKFRPDVALDAIERRRATIFVGVPAMYRMMDEAGAEDARPVVGAAVGVGRRRHAARAGSPVPEASARPRTCHCSGGAVGEAAFVDGYGMVELGGGVAVKVLPPGLPLPLGGLVGLPPARLPACGSSTTPVTSAPRRRGRAAVRGPGVMRGYHGARRRHPPRRSPTDGWLRTGDLARRGRLGLVEFAGRKKDVIKHGGYSVFAAEVESVLEEHPAWPRRGRRPAGRAQGRDPGGGGALPRRRRPSARPSCWHGPRSGWPSTRGPSASCSSTTLPRTGTDKVRKADVVALFDGEPNGP